MLSMEAPESICAISRVTQNRLNAPDVYIEKPENTPFTMLPFEELTRITRALVVAYGVLVGAGFGLVLNEGFVLMNVEVF